MASTTIERPLTDAELAKQIAVVNGKITKAQADVEWVEAEVTKETDRLSELRQRYSDGCRQLAAGESVDIVALQNKMRPVEARIEGLRLTATEKRAVLSPLQAERNLLQQEQFSRARFREVAAERAAIEDEIARGLEDVAARDKLQEAINQRIGNLRSRACLIPSHVGLAKNGAAKIENVSVGIRG